MAKQLDLFGFEIEPAEATAEKTKLVAPAPDQVFAIEDSNENIVAEEPTTVQKPLPEYISEVKPPIKAKGKRGRKSIKEMESEAHLIQIPPDEILFQKQYYPIRDVAKMFQLNASLLRYWETEFDILKPRKNRKGDRHFRPEDIRNLELIHHLLRQRKFTIEGAKTYLKSSRTKAKEEFDVVARLQKIRSFLLELKATL